MICDGRYTKFDSFLRHSQKNKYQGFIFLYDQDSILYKRYQFKGYPVELLVNKQQIVATKLGYDDSFSELYYEKQIRLIKTILDENDD